MANSGVSYTAHAFIQQAGGDWQGKAVGTGNVLLSDEISMEGLVSKIISGTITTPDSAVSNICSLQILKKTGSGAFQDAASDNDNFRSYPINIEQNTVTRWSITLYAVDTNDFKINLTNGSGQTLTTDFREENGDITPAS